MYSYGLAATLSMCAVMLTFQICSYLCFAFFSVPSPSSLSLSLSRSLSLLCVFTYFLSPKGDMGQCERQAEDSLLFCELHTCGTPGCRGGKSSRATHCPTCSERLGLGVASADTAGRTTTTSARTCAYASDGKQGQCQRKPLEALQFCELHACEIEGCSASKSSRVQVCTVCAKSIAGKKGKGASIVQTAIPLRGPSSAARRSREPLPPVPGGGGM